MIYLGLSLFVLASLVLLRFPFSSLWDRLSQLFMRAMVGAVSLYALHLTAGFSDFEWEVPITYFTAGFALLCGIPGVLGVLVLSFLN
ncbi:pro-sigmaK processing inhibitor BofA family protein [Chryseomicrobium palamuruense]|uniref:Pro-sigmaK processing inhibitor BofA family protein n=1 Tax=Chryseomicrobium palamuruense TaxID=682973 RepID=A0ABV8UQS2_9BACL